MSDVPSIRVRRGRQNSNYTAISNRLIDHPTLSPNARLVLIYLLSKPPDWQLQVSDLRRLNCPSFLDALGFHFCSRSNSTGDSIPCFVCPSPDRFAFEQVEEALRYRIIVAVTTPAHHCPAGKRSADERGSAPDCDV